MSEFEKVDCVVIGAGVVGLAVARELALAGREVIVLESAELIGSETSSRNSEVIHAGIYYPKGSLRAEFCVRGKQMMYPLSLFFVSHVSFPFPLPPPSTTYSASAGRINLYTDVS